MSKSGFGAVGLGRLPQRLLVARVKARRRVLHPVAQLAQHVVGHVVGVLGAEIDADALGPDQPRHLLDLVHQRLGRVVEQQVRLVEEEHQLRLVGIAHLGQLLEQFRQQPQQEGRVKPRAAISRSAARIVDPPAPVGIACASGPQAPAPARRRASPRPAPPAPAAPAGSRRSSWRRCCRSAAPRSLAFSPTQTSSACRSLRSSSGSPCSSATRNAMFSTPSCTAVRSSSRASSSGPISATVVRTGWPCSPNRSQKVTGKAAVGIVGQPDRRRPRLERLVQLEPGRAGRAQPRQVALHVGHEHRHARGREAFGQDLQGHRLAGAGGAGDQPVAVGLSQQQMLRRLPVGAGAPHEDVCRLIRHRTVPLPVVPAPSTGPAAAPPLRFRARPGPAGGLPAPDHGILIRFDHVVPVRTGTWSGRTDFLPVRLAALHRKRGLFCLLAASGFHPALAVDRR